MVSARIDEDLIMAKFDDPGFPDETGELGEELRLVLGIAARKVLEGVDDAAFLEWARDAIPNLAPAMLVDVPPQELDREAF